MTVVTAPPARSGREAYRDLLVDLMAQDERLVCLDSDTGLFNGTDFGAGADRVVNLGIAEQNLVGVAAGVARSGLIPFVNTMAAFASTRALEAVKIDVSYARTPVRIVATHAGLAAGHLGPTHHCLEDLAVMRMLPGMTVVVPADAAAAESLIRQCVNLDGPAYIRLGRAATPDLGAEPPELGRAQVLRDGADATIVACGPYPVRYALAAAEQLAGDGIAAGVVNMHTVKPLDTAVLAGATTVVTVEEHWTAGGLGSAVAEVLADRAGTRLAMVGVRDRFLSMAGSHEFLLAQAGITPDAVAAAVHGLLGDPAGEGR